MSATPATPQRPMSSAHASSSPSTARPQIRASSSAIIPDTTGFQGTFPVSIGAGTAIHPRVKIYSFDGPVYIGEGCIIGEKSIIGAPSVPPKQPVRDASSSERPARPTVIENFVNDWSVLWGGPGNLRSRQRANGDGAREPSGKSSGLGGRAVEDGRLIVLNKEREVVRKLMAASLGARKK
ncbi:hypothetical protein KEM56_004520 [Ascosphaera pollenicola]|nr:hypothetical protein KEM56_004520 [Ascosphaera pollenicola]